jgi:glycine cleavage system regulatory protein
MNTSLVLTFMGRDKPGLANAISQTVTAAGGNWLESRVASLAEKFAGIVLVSVPEPNVADLSAALRSLDDLGLRITVELSRAAPLGPDYKILELNLVAQDRPGIVRDVTQALHQLGANIEAFSSDIESAAFTGETMFRATARITIAKEITPEEVQLTLEQLPDEIIVDFMTSGDKPPV